MTARAGTGAEPGDRGGRGVTVAPKGQHPKGRRRSYERLGPVDAAFLHLETPETPMHVGSLSLLEGAPLTDEAGRLRLDDVWRRVESRLELVPRFRKRLMEVPFDQGRPVWVDDETFDVANHVRLVALPAPGTYRQLKELSARLFMQLLDRSRPLWELWLIEGVEGGRVGLVTKIHHALVDGVSSVDVISVTCSFSPEPAPSAPPRWHPVPPPSPARLLVESVLERSQEPVALTRAAARVLRHPQRALTRAGEVATALATFAHPDTLAPRSSINRAHAGRERRIEQLTIGLDAARTVRATFGGTVNDVVLAAVTGGLRHLLVQRGDDVGGLTLKAMVPVSLRRDDDGLTLGNRVSTMFASLPVGEADPLARLRKVQAETQSLKDHHQALVPDLFLDATGHAPPALLAALCRITQHQRLINIVVTNIPGPDRPWYLLGAKTLDVVPLVPMVRNLDVGIAVLSYAGMLRLGLYADAETCPDVGVLAEGISLAFAELERLAEHTTPAPTPATAG